MDRANTRTSSSRGRFQLQYTDLAAVVSENQQQLETLQYVLVVCYTPLSSPKQILTIIPIHCLSVCPLIGNGVGLLAIWFYSFRLRFSMLPSRISTDSE